MYFSLDGERVEGRAGDTLAAALVRLGVSTITRSIKYHRPRGAFCLAGTCGQCLVRVDGVPSVMACQTALHEGLTCERQNGPLGVDTDVFRAADFVFGKGLDHHHLMVQSKLLGRVALEVARRLAGLGELPDKTRGAVPAEERTAALAIVGAGPAGLAAAQAAIDAGVKDVLLIERDPHAGGAIGQGLVKDDRELGSRTVAALGERLITNAELVGMYRDDDPKLPARLLVRRHDRLLFISAQRVLLAHGGASQPLPVPGNDRPGVYAARGLLGLAKRCDVRVQRGGEVAKVVVIGTGDELAQGAKALEGAGYPLVRAIDAAQVIELHGDPVDEVIVKSASGAQERLRCGAVAIALPLAPLHEPASNLGAHTKFLPASDAFALQADADGRTTVPWIFAAGTLVGAGGVEAAESGAKAGAAAARECTERAS
ncbi:MAG: (2Fe-2S)-binding protein [Deltaproteobacteria bacterium]|nr:(2Fe-2S)-binding protein [Deltaproteobacteria bacterium]